MKVLARKRFSKFQCEDVSGIHDTSLMFNTECDADIRKNSYANFMPSVGTALFQGNVERVTKEPTVLAPSKMNFPVVAPPECRGGQMSLRSTEIVDFSRSTSVSKFSKCPRNIRYVLSVAIAGNVECLAPFTMKCIFSFVSCGPRTALHHRVHSARHKKKNDIFE